MLQLCVSCRIEQSGGFNIPLERSRSRAATVPLSSAVVILWAEDVFSRVWGGTSMVSLCSALKACWLLSGVQSHY